MGQRRCGRKAVGHMIRDSVLAAVKEALKEHDIGDQLLALGAVCCAWDVDENEVSAPGAGEWRQRAGGMDCGRHALTSVMAEIRMELELEVE